MRCGDSVVERLVVCRYVLRSVVVCFMEVSCGVEVRIMMVSVCGVEKCSEFHRMVLSSISSMC